MCNNELTVDLKIGNNEMIFLKWQKKITTKLERKSMFLYIYLYKYVLIFLYIYLYKYMYMFTTYISKMREK